MFKSLAEVKKANKGIGHHWFDTDTMKFWKTRLETDLLGHRYFVTSDEMFDRSRAYTIRQANDDGTIDTVGDFGQYKTRKAAIAEAKALAEEWTYHPMNGEP